MNSKKAWPLLEQLPPGPTKENLLEIRKTLEEIENMNQFLLTLAGLEARGEKETVTLAVNTVQAISATICGDVDGVFYHLNLIFGEKAPDPAAAQGGE